MVGDWIRRVFRKTKPVAIGASASSSAPPIDGTEEAPTADTSPFSIAAHDDGLGFVGEMRQRLPSRVTALSRASVCSSGTTSLSQTASKGTVRMRQFRSGR